MPTTTEQQYQAELLRQRVREQQLAKAEEENAQRTVEEIDPMTGTVKKKGRKRLPLSTIEIGLWIFPAMTLDFFEFFGQVLAAIPGIGWALAGASSIMEMVFSGIMFLIITFWLLLKGVLPIPGRGLTVFLVLLGTTFGNAIINWLPGWTGFFIWLLFMTYKQSLPSIMHK